MRNMLILLFGVVFFSSCTVYLGDTKPPEHVKNDLEKAEEFWRNSSKYNAKVCQELKQAKERGMLTVVVSASPHLFIAPAVKSLGADLLIATPLTIKPSAYLLGENCRGKEKIRRLKEEFGELNMLVAYSDNEDDVPLLRLAEKGYRVVKNEIVPLT